MDISIQQLQDRYIKANTELDLHGLKIADKLATGLAKQRDLKMFNMMSAIISYIGERLDPPTSVLGARPSITLPIPPKVSDIGGDFSMGIENVNGRYVSILGLRNFNISPYTLHPNYSQADASEYFYQSSNDPLTEQTIPMMIEFFNSPEGSYNFFVDSVDYYKNRPDNSMKYIDDNGIDRGSFSFVFNNNIKDRFTVIFPETSDFNGQRIKVSNNDFGYSDTMNGSNTSIFNILPISGGSNQHSSGSYLSLETIKVYNKALEEIAIELNISYS